MNASKAARPQVGATPPSINSGPVKVLPEWGRRLTGDGVSLEMHQPNGYQVDMCLSRHLITYWLAPAVSRRAIESDRLQDVRFPHGSFNVTPAGTRLKAVSEHPAKALLFTVEQEFLQRVAPEWNGLTPTRNDAQNGVASASLHHLARLACEMLSQAGSPSRLYLESMLSMVLLETLNSTQTEIYRQLPVPSNERTRKRMNAVRDYIIANLASAIGLHELAALANMSVYHFSRCFKEYFGMTPHQFVLHERIDASRALLTRQHHTLAEVALLCGFSHQAHFSRAFKSITGTTPGAFRAQHSRSC